VKVSPEVAKLLSEPAYLNPEIVKIRAPKSLFDNQPKDEPLVVYADFANREDLKTKTKANFESVPVYWGAHRENVHISPATVAADLLLQTKNLEYTIGSVTIYKKSPADFDKDYIVNFSPTISNVHVTGPSDQIELIKKDPKICDAILFVDNFNKDQGQATLKFELPPGVTVSAPVTFPYTTKRRE
jgi:YbbR domain-containing protein